MAHM